MEVLLVWPTPFQQRSQSETINIEFKSCPSSAQNPPLTSNLTLKAKFSQSFIASLSTVTSVTFLLSAAPASQFCICSFFLPKISAKLVHGSLSPFLLYSNLTFSVKYSLTILFKMATPKPPHLFLLIFLPSTYDHHWCAPQDLTQAHQDNCVPPPL